MPRVLAVIPARLESRRFPRKVLARDTGKYLVEHVWERVVRCPRVDRVIVATDSEEVVAAADSFGAEARLTSAHHVSGTDRVAEVAAGLDHEIVINVQGDEPLLEPGDLETLIRLFEGDDSESRVPPGSGGAGAPAAGTSVVMTTLAVERDDEEGFGDPNVVKVVLGERGRALYFTRAPAPWWDAAAGPTGGGSGTAASGVPWLQHVGIYAYRRDFLLRISSLAPTALERRERLEQLRVLEHGYAIRVGITRSRHLGIDTAEEYRRFVAQYAREHGGGRGADPPGGGGSAARATAPG